MHGCGITLRGNVMHDAPHSAVLYGGNEHLFEYNNVYRVLLETGDAGAYYTGRDWTTHGDVLRFNYTHDLGAEGEMANTMGFYFDDCDCGDEVYGNVFHNVSRGIMVGGGREHPIRNNIFSRCIVGMSIDCRGMTWKHWNSAEHGGSSWMLEDKAKAFDYTKGVWAARYPRLADIMRDHPREPLYNPVENNIFIDCRKQILALDREAPLARMAPIANNVVVNTRGTNGVAAASANPNEHGASGEPLRTVKPAAIRESIDAAATPFVPRVFTTTLFAMGAMRASGASLSRARICFLQSMKMLFSTGLYNGSRGWSRMMSARRG